MYQGVLSNTTRDKGELLVESPRLEEETITLGKMWRDLYSQRKLGNLESRLLSSSLLSLMNLNLMMFTRSLRAR